MNNSSAKFYSVNLNIACSINNFKLNIKQHSKLAKDSLNLSRFKSSKKIENE